MADAMAIFLEIKKMLVDEHSYFNTFERDNDIRIQSATNSLMMEILFLNNGIPVPPQEIYSKLVRYNNEIMLIDVEDTDIRSLRRQSKSSAWHEVLWNQACEVFGPFDNDSKPTNVVSIKG